MSLNWVYVVLFAVTVGESSAFVGLAVPGEVAVLGAGALVARGELDLVPVIVLVAAVGVAGYLVHRQRRTSVVTKLVATIDDR